MNDKYDVTVLIVTYNSEYKKLQKTIDSILEQIDIYYQIVIADDGSECDNFDLVKKYFDDRNFTDYVLVSNKDNQGTVKNIVSGLDRANGIYLKTISPGDYLDNELVLTTWINELKNSKRKWSFSNAVFYKSQNGQTFEVAGKHNPIMLSPYKRENIKECIWNYVVLGDGALGAATLSETKVFSDYLEKIKDRVIYAEDMVFRLMMFEGITPYYYNNKAIWYEYGDGISTNNNDKWKMRLQNDLKETDNQIIGCLNVADNYQRKIIKELSYKEENKLKNIVHNIFLHGKIKKALLARRMECK